MRFDELASDAGDAAADIGRQADRPSLNQMLERQSRRRRLTALSSAGALAIVALLVVQLVPSQQSSLLGAAPISTTSTSVTPSSSSDLSSTTTTTQQETPSVSRDQCPVTIPGPDSFVPASELPEVTPPSPQGVWYGSPRLWTFVETEGQIWLDLPVSTGGGLTQKTFWWSTDFVSISDPMPEVSLSAERLDGTSVTAAESANFGGNPEQGVFVVAGFQIPGDGCWRFTTSYAGATVDYVAWVEGR